MAGTGEPVCALALLRPLAALASVAWRLAFQLARKVCEGGWRKVGSCGRKGEAGCKNDLNSRLAV